MKLKPILNKVVVNGLKVMQVVYVILLFTLNGHSKENFNLKNNISLFSIGKIADITDVLFQYKPAQSKWIMIGETGTSAIYSIAINSDDFIIYAVNGGVLGTINPITAQFTEIGTIGGGTGPYGFITITQVYGLAFDPIEEILYATNRISDSEDVLIKINPLNGKLLNNQFTNAVSQKIDYIAIEASVDKATVNESHELADVTCLIYDPSTTQMRCLQRKLNNIAMALIDKNTGDLIEVLFDMSSSGIFSIDYDLTSNLYATSLNQLDTENGIIQTDLGFGNINVINPQSHLQPNLQFIGIAFVKTDQLIEECDEHINLTCTTPQMAEVKADQTIHSNMDILISTSYQSKQFVSLHNNFNIPKSVNFSAEIIDDCD